MSYADTSTSRLLPMGSGSDPPDSTFSLSSLNEPTPPRSVAPRTSSRSVTAGALSRARGMRDRYTALRTAWGALALVMEIGTVVLLVCGALLLKYGSGLERPAGFGLLAGCIVLFTVRWVLGAEGREATLGAAVSMLDAAYDSQTSSLDRQGDVMLIVRALDLDESGVCSVN